MYQLLCFHMDGKTKLFSQGPFCILSAPIHLQRVLDDAIRHLANSKVHVDNSLIHVNGVTAHLTALKILFSVLWSLELTLKTTKCSMEFSYLD